MRGVAPAPRMMARCVCEGQREGGREEGKRRVVLSSYK